jgi:hypothetical protein
MRRTRAALTLLLAFLPGLTANGQNASKAAPFAVPSYRISFESRAAASGSGGWMALASPFECTSDGTIFVDFVTTPPANPAIQPPVFPATTLVAVSPDGHSQTFHLDQAPKLNSATMSFYAAESGVTFLVSGTLENKLVNGTSTGPDGGQHEFVRNDAERHVYILSFSPDGTYQKSTEIQPPFPVQRLGVFQSGTLLAYGYDWKSRTRRLALLTKDGTHLRELQVPPDDAQDAALGESRSSRGAQLMPHDHSILVLQKGTFPLLEVSERGEIRVLRPKLPAGQHIETLVPSDQGLYAIVSPEGRGSGMARRPSAEPLAMYEISPEDGTSLRRFAWGYRATLGVACVHDRKFLSIDYADGKMVPLVGSVTPEPAADQLATFPPEKLN